MKMEVSVLLKLILQVMHSDLVSKYFPIDIVEMFLLLEDFNILVDVLINVSRE